MSKEDWGWVEMKLREVKALTFKKPVRWNPEIDPRPDWRIKEIPNQNQMKGTPTRLGEAEAQPKQISAETEKEKIDSDSTISQLRDTLK